MTESCSDKFDPDVRDQIDLTVVHGSWRKEDANRLYIEEAVARHKNVKAITAYMPEPFGTHHSKMIITVRHDDLAQVCIFTANLIARDWNMCQAVWRSPLLPLLKSPDSPKLTENVGSGLRFKFDLLSYLRAYQKRLQDLVSTLEKYNFNEIRAALIASTPCRQGLGVAAQSSTRWGWPGLQNVLDQIQCKSSDPHIVVQISSVATLGVQDTYLRKTIFSALAHSKDRPSSNKPEYSIIFPTAEEIRRSVTGYACGASIHMKIQTPQQVKQLEYLRPYLCHWAPDLRNQENVRRAGRRRAGPHIKTYVRFTDEGMTKIDWAMVTSANLSKQAWGAEAGKDGAVRICSYEIGVILWPALWQESPNEEVEMVPTFKKDEPERMADEAKLQGHQNVRVGFRMPYDLPLVPYKSHEEPWCATKTYTEPDWMGGVWGTN